MCACSSTPATSTARPIIPKQQIAVQYRIGETGAWTNVPAGYISDATQGPSIAGQVTPIDVTLPSEVNNQAQVQVRILTTNAVGNDEWVGIDDINVSSDPISSTVVSIGDATITEGDSGTKFLTFTVTRSDNAGDFTVDYLTADGSAKDGSDYAGAIRLDRLHRGWRPHAGDFHRHQRRHRDRAGRGSSPSRSAKWSTRRAGSASAMALRPARSKPTISRWS